MRTVIDKVVGVREYKTGDYITTIEIDDGGERLRATYYGQGKDWKVGDKVIVYLHDKYNSLKFYKDNS